MGYEGDEKIYPSEFSESSVSVEVTAFCLVVFFYKTSLSAIRMQRPHLEANTWFNIAEIIGKFEFKVTVHYDLRAKVLFKASQLDAFCNRP